MISDFSEGKKCLSVSRENSRKLQNISFHDYILFSCIKKYPPHTLFFLCNVPKLFTKMELWIRKGWDVVYQLRMKQLKRMSENGGCLIDVWLLQAQTSIIKFQLKIYILFKHLIHVKFLSKIWWKFLIAFNDFSLLR